jgi:hypothetical protein
MGTSTAQQIWRIAASFGHNSQAFTLESNCLLAMLSLSLQAFTVE